MGGSISAREVPWAVCWSKPRKYINAGTMINPPPIPTNPLAIPAKIPMARRMNRVDISISGKL